MCSVIENVSSLNRYGERLSVSSETKSHPNIVLSSRLESLPHASIEEIKMNTEIMLTPISVISNRISETGSYEDWYGSDVVVPRDADRILEQFVLMMLRIGAYWRKEGIISVDYDVFKRKSSHAVMLRHDSHHCSTMPSDDTDTPSFVGSSKGNTASYVREYPQIFMKKPSDLPRSSENKIAAVKTVHSHVENDESGNILRTRKRTVSISPTEKICLDIERNVNRRIILPANKNKRKDLENRPKPSKPTEKSRRKSSDRKQLATQNLSEVNSNSRIDLNKMITSSDSLRSLVENVNRMTQDKNNFNEANRDSSSSDTQKHEKKD